MKIYQKHKRRNAAVVLISIWSLFLGMQLMRLFTADDLLNFNNYFEILLPIVSLIMFFTMYFYPNLEIKNGQLIKYDLFIKHKINIDEIEYIKKVFGDIHVKGKNKIIVVNHDLISEDDQQRLLGELESRTSLKLA
jgi:hypothetical protein